MNKTQFEFRGDGLIYFLFWFVTPVLAIITLYLGTPWIYCWKKKWFISNSFVNNRKLIFTGTGSQVFGLFIKIFFFSIFTFGLYIPFGIVSIKRWELKHTFFEDEIYPNSTALQNKIASNIINPAIERNNDNLFLEEQTSEDGLEFTCINCHTLLELDKEEIKLNLFICPVCKTENTIYAEQSAYLVKEELIPIAEIPEKDYTCISCSSVITLEGDDLQKNSFQCPVCGNVNPVQV